MIQRRAARAVMMTPEKRVLLMQAQEPSGDFKIWYTPGGGFESDENAETCLNREIMEETGLKHVNIGPRIWHRHHKFDWGNDIYDQHEDFYLVPVEQFNPDMRSNPSETELNAFCQFKWWTHKEIIQSNDEFAPGALGEHLESLIINGPPESPFDVGI